ncbi:DNA ligase 1 [Metarhizium anisopliae]|nr:DNA ligase 1 [Metarhizium anisopliae]
MAPPKQATLGKFFGVKNPAPQQQTKLTFATKARAVEGGDEDASAKENTDPDHGEFLFDRDANNTAMKEGIADVSWLDSKKRARVPSQNSTVKPEDDEDDGPVVKRVRRSRVKVEEDEDDEPAQSVPKKEDNVKDVTIKQSVEEVPKKEGDAKDVKIKKKSQSPDPDRKPLKTADDGFKEEAASESGSEAEEDADVDEKPEVAAKAREKVQTQLQSKTAQQPYPDWQPGSPVPYAALCQTFSLIEMTTKRLIIMGHCSLFLRQVMRLTPDDLLPTVLLMINKLAPDYAGIELGIGESLIMKAIGETTGRSLQIIKADQKEIGDLGLVAVKSRSTQPTMFKPKPLTVRGVHQGLMNIATVTGNGAQGRKVDGIKKLLSAADAYSTAKADITKDKGGPSEAKFIIRFLEGKLRLGLAERTVLVSLAQAIVCHEAEQKGKVPSTTDMENGESILKTVYRNSEDLSKKYPDILAKLHTWVKNDTKSFVLDCETVAWDVSEKKVLPFQQLMTRKKKDVKLEDVKVKVCVFAFDLLYLNGLPVVEKSLRERRELLQQSFAPVEGEFAFATYMDGQELDEIQLFLDESVKASCEGLMVKMLDGTESGYEPSKRSRNWLKVKKDYLAGVGDSLDLVVLGAYYGRGKRTSVYGAFLLACYDPANDTYETVCNIGTGFSEQVLEELHAQLSEIVIDRPKPFYSHSAGGQHQPDVWFEPRYVWEVKTADLTLSPRYKAGCKEGVDPAGDKGISLRFPRFIKIRDDKKPDEATSSRQIAEMYRKQESVTKNKGPSVDDDFEY